LSCHRPSRASIDDLQGQGHTSLSAKSKDALALPCKFHRRDLCFVYQRGKTKFYT